MECSSPSAAKTVSVKLTRTDAGGGQDLGELSSAFLDWPVRGSKKAYM